MNTYDTNTGDEEIFVYPSEISTSDTRNMKYVCHLCGSNFALVVENSAGEVLSARCSGCGQAFNFTDSELLKGGDV